MPNNKNAVYVFGHKNPDTDSTCAAITYAWLKNKLDSEKEYIPAVLGEINAETEFCLEYFSVEKPKKLESLKPRVADMRLERIQPVREQDSILEVVQKIVKTSGKTLPVADDRGRLMGIISITDLVPAMLSSRQNHLTELEIPITNLISVLELSKLQGELEDDVFRGNVYVFSDLTYYSRISRNGLIICNRHEFGTGFMFSLEPKYIIVADVDDSSVLNPIEDYKGVIFTSRKNIYDLVQAINLALPVSDLIKKENLEYYDLYEYIEDVRKNLITSKYRSYPVVDEHGKLQACFHAAI